MSGLSKAFVVALLLSVAIVCTFLKHGAEVQERNHAPTFLADLGPWPFVYVGGGACLLAIALVVFWKPRGSTQG
jgi:hypothetical protein